MKAQYISQVKKLILIILLSPLTQMYGQADTARNYTDYSFILQDAPARLFTMRQMNQSYLSGYRLFARSLNSTIQNEKISDLIQIGLQSLLFLPLTHEEGHRSVLTAYNIGSISQPYFNKHGAAYVKGVTDQTLQNLRDNDLPTYIRLHTGGLESDYMLTKRMETMGSFEQDSFKYYKWEYAMRKLGILQYYLLGLVKYEVDLDEETNELERDIVGFDTYGAARHLYRPNMDFYRYTRYKDLTNDERKFVKRMGFRSLLNLMNPLILGKENFKINEHTKVNAGLGYTAAPFGDFIDENIWLKYKKANISLYVRQFQNRTNWFHGAGLALVEYQIHERVNGSFYCHYWNQPNNFDFNTGSSFSGGAVDLELKYFFMKNMSAKIKGLSVDLGAIYKSKGFLPEDVFLQEYFGLRFGTTLRI